MNESQFVNNLGKNNYTAKNVAKNVLAEQFNNYIVNANTLYCG